MFLDVLKKNWTCAVRSYNAVDLQVQPRQEQKRALF